jgi:hypothetical protein
MSPHCIIPGCNRSANHNFGVRLRRPDTTAVWAPNTEAYLCDHHASAGLRIMIILESNNSQEIETIVYGVPQRSAERITPILRNP